nr:hypothetical protein [Nostoc sp. DedSLP01]
MVGLPRQPTSASRRVWQRYGNIVNATNVANRTISALNELAVSFSDRERPLLFNHRQVLNPAEARNPPNAMTITAAQSRLLAHVYRCATRTLRRRESPDSTSDDPLFDSNFLSTHLRNADLDAYISRPTSPVAPIDADRVSLPGDAAAVKLNTILPPAVAAAYADPAALLLPVSDRKRAPRTRLCGTQREWTTLVQRMRAIDMVDFTTSPKCVSGIFCVAKDGGKLRLIMDARPVNVMFVEPEPVKLPTPDLTAALTTDPTRPLYAAKVDLDNFFYRLELAPEWWPYFALPPVCAADVGVADRFGAGAVVYPVCKRLPMGWAHSPRLAQAAHEHLIDTQTGLRPADRICADNDTVVDRERHQEYIDDLILYDYDPVRLAATQQRYIAAVRRAGLVVKDSKVVPPSCDGVVCLGLEVHGVDHTVGASVAKLDALRADTRRVLRAGGCSGTDLAHVVGRWTWAAMACRPVLSVFNAVYRFIECAKGRRFTLWRSAARELLLVMDLAPLMFVDTSADWFDRVVATDASSEGLGVVAAPLEADAAPRVVTGADSAALAASSAWRTIVSSRWRRAEHINVLELRALTTAVRWVLSFREAINCRVLVLCDSQVVVGAVTKGRSSSQPLLRRLRYLAAMVLASGLRLALRWVASADNPADGPSRNF